MQASRHKPLNVFVLLAVAVTVALPLLVLPSAGLVPWLLAGVALLAVAMLYVHLGDLLTLLLAWLAVTSILGVHFYVLELPGFFNVTIDRLMLAALAGMFVVAILLGRVQVQWPRNIGWLLLALVGWTALTAQAAGWTLPPALAGQPAISPPYYRFFVGFLFPAIVFFMAVSLIRREHQIRVVLWFFSLFGLYLTVIGLAELLILKGWLGGGWWRWIVWPRYILDPEVGIHVNRVRGPFINAPDMGLTLVVCLFANLLLMAKTRAATRAWLALASLPMPVLIFFTLTRSIWLAFVACLAVAIFFWPRSRSLAKAAAFAALAVAVVFTLLQWDRLSSPDRTRGGMAEAAPVISRFELAKVSIDMAVDRPLLGVGLGHFQQAAATNPLMTEFGSPAYTYGAGAVEHNNFLSMLAETGLIGAALYAAVIFGLLAISIRLYRMIPATAIGFLDRRFVVFFWIVWLAFFIDSMFRLTTSSPFPNGMFLLAGGVIVGLYYRLRPQPIRTPLPPPALGLAGRSGRR